MEKGVYRNEWKHLITLSDMIAIRQRLRAVAKPDPHAIDGKYIIRSLYFDNARDKALREKNGFPVTTQRLCKSFVASLPEI